MADCFTTELLGVISLKFKSSISSTKYTSLGVIQHSINLSEIEMNGVLGYDSALVRLYWAEDILGLSEKTPRLSHIMFITVGYYNIWKRFLEL